MTLSEDDKDILIKALCRALTIYEENKRLKRFVKERTGVDVDMEKSKKGKDMKNTPKNRIKEAQKTVNTIKNGRTQTPLRGVPNIDSWGDLTEGRFDERLNSMIEDLVEEESDEEEEGGEDDDDDAR